MVAVSLPLPVDVGTTSRSTYTHTKKTDDLTRTINRVESIYIHLL